MRMPGPIEIVRRLTASAPEPARALRVAKHFVTVASRSPALPGPPLAQGAAAVDQVAHLGIRQFAALRDPMDDLPAIELSTPRPLRDARGSFCFGQHIHRVLNSSR